MFGVANLDGTGQLRIQSGAGQQRRRDLPDRRGPDRSSLIGWHFERVAAHRAAPFPQVGVNVGTEQPVFVGAAVGQVAGVTQMNLFMPDPGNGKVDLVQIGSSTIWVWTK